MDPRAQPPSTTKTAGRSIRNPYTFSLGCLLTRLAYQEPLRDLLQPDDIVDGDEDGLDTRLRISDRVRKSLVLELGSPYRKVVRKCIHCDFGNDNDLTDPALMGSFESDVINVLERLERKFKFGLGEV